MQSCPLCGSGPFNKSHFKEHELTQKHLKAFKAQQEQASSLQQCHVCGSGSFTKQGYEQHCLTQKHLLAAQQNEQESQRLSRQTAAIAAAVCEEREDQIPAIIVRHWRHIRRRPLLHRMFVLFAQVLLLLQNETTNCAVFRKSI